MVTEGKRSAGRPRKPKDARELLKASSMQAVEVLIQVMEDENTKPELRVKCAEGIMDRVYGKSATAIEDIDNSSISITLEGEVGDYAK